MAVLQARYLRRDETGQQIEDASAMLDRVAAAIAEPCRSFGEDAELWRERFRHRLERLEFLPNSPTLMNAGLAHGQLAACFVLPIEDNLDSIFRTLGLAARIQQTGGGTGFSFSRLRSRGDVVCSTGGISSGPVSFMELFDHSTAVIRAGGRRRGANMAVLRVDHPDIFEFIDSKRSPGRLENFNLSVGVTDDFFSSLKSSAPLPLKDPRSGRIRRNVSAARLFDQLTESTWACGDPGLLFLDEISRRNPLPSLGSIEATNPCGEQPLLPYESCTLGSINLGKFASGNSIDWGAFGETIRDAVTFLDNVIEANHYPSPQIQQATLRTRKIGLGVMGLADLLAEIGVPVRFGAGSAARRRNRQVHEPDGVQSVRGTGTTPGFISGSRCERLARARLQGYAQCHGHLCGSYWNDRHNRRRIEWHRTVLRTGDRATNPRRPEVRRGERICGKRTEAPRTGR